MVTVVPLLCGVRRSLALEDGLTLWTVGKPREWASLSGKIKIKSLDLGLLQGSVGIWLECQEGVPHPSPPLRVPVTSDPSGLRDLDIKCVWLWHSLCSGVLSQHHLMRQP